MAINPAAAEEFQKPNLRAYAAVVIDFDTGELLFERNAHAPRAPASMTKIMTAFIIYEEIESGRLTLDTLVPISQNAARVSRSYQGVYFPLSYGIYHTVDSLLHLMMLPSSNGACVALAEFVSGSEDAFVIRMNDTAERLGMWAEFQNAHGAVDRDHLTNAYSIGRLVREFIYRYPDILRITGQNNYTFLGRNINNTNLLLSRRPFFGADGFKTGTTAAAGFNLSSTAYRDGRRIIAVVMGAPSNAHRYDNSIALLEFGFAQAARNDAIRALTEQQRREAEMIEARWQEYLQQVAIQSKIDVVIDGRQLIYNYAFPRILYGLSMVSARDFFGALQMRYHMDGRGNILVNTHDGRDVLFLANQDFIFVAGEFVPSYPLQVVDGELFITIRYAAAALGNIEISWDDLTRTVYVNQITQYQGFRQEARPEAYDVQIFEHSAEPETFQFRGRTFFKWLFVVLAAGVFGSAGIALFKILGQSLIHKKT